jgi:ADP-L-glycero-D-manno-heptose 6-epimerase
MVPMILVTGAYGFIGSKFVKYLNSKGIHDIVVCDYLTNGKQFKNLDGTKFKHYISPDRLTAGVLKLGFIKQVFHFGAISDTTCWDGELVMARNYNFSVDRRSNGVDLGIPSSYSSSASVYGNGNGPLNLYAYSKFLVDNFVEGIGSDLVQGFRYFNVFSLDDAEWHKGDQASPYYKFKQQALETGCIKVFEGSEGFLRDFIHVDTLCNIQYEMSQRKTPGIFDLGSGKQISFMDVAKYVAYRYDATVEEIPFPSHLRGCYQTSTLADMSYFDPT